MKYLTLIFLITIKLTIDKLAFLHFIWIGAAQQQQTEAEFLRNILFKSVSKRLLNTPSYGTLILAHIIPAWWYWCICHELGESFRHEKEKNSSWAFVLKLIQLISLLIYKRKTK
jgi:hypothetical protein